MPRFREISEGIEIAATGKNLIFGSVNTLKTSPYYLPVILAVCGLTLTTVYGQFVMADIGDKTWLLLAARMLLEGKRLYVDVFEVNPPLIIWLHTLPVRLANLLHTQDNYALIALTYLLAACSVALCMRILSANIFYKTHHLPDFLLLLVLILITLVHPVYFADREHISTLLVFPYILRLLPSVRAEKMPPALRTVIGIMAGVGFCIKPHCIVIFIAIQLAVLVRERTVRVLFAYENCIIYTAGILYPLAVWHFAPEYFTELLPMAMATYGYSRWIIFSYLFFHPACSLVVAMLGFRWRAASPYRADIGYGLALAAGGVAYAFANNGWDYTFFPLNSYVLLTIGLVWLEYLWLRREPASPRAYGIAYLLGLIAGITANLYSSYSLGFTLEIHSYQAMQFTKLFAVAFMLLPGLYIARSGWRSIRNIRFSFFPYGPYACAAVIAAKCMLILCVTTYQLNSLERLHLSELILCRREFDSIAPTAPKTFGTISFASDLWPYLTTNSGAAMVTRYNQFWMLMGLKNPISHYQSLPEYDDSEFRNRNAVVLHKTVEGIIADINRNKPRVIIVERLFDFMPEYLKTYPEFAEIWKKYALAETLNACPYVFYKRIE